MESITNFIEVLLSPGPILFMPIIIMFFVFLIKIYSRKSITWIDGIRSALTLGIAFVAMFLVIDFMLIIFTDPFLQIQKVLAFDTVDLGWSPMSALSWAWEWAFLMFPIQIIINAVMLRLRWTKVLNADMWNVWNKVLTALVVTFFLSAVMNDIAAVVISMVIGGVWVILELKNGDVMYERQHNLTKIPGVVSPHSMFLAGSYIYFIDKWLQKVPFFKDTSQSQVAQRDTVLLKTLRDNMFVGFILGLVLMLCTMWFDLDAWVNYVLLPFNLAAALVLFPMVSQLFTKSLVPIGIAIQNIMTKKFKGRELYIGLDWPILAGNSKLWIVATMLIPFEIVYAIIMSYIPGLHMIFPLASLINVCLAPVLLVICNANMKRMFVAGIIVVPFYLLFGALAAPAVTEIALDNPTMMSDATNDVLESGLYISNSGFEAPVLRTGLSVGVQFISGDITTISSIGFIFLIGWSVSFGFYYREMKVMNQKLRQERLEKEGVKDVKELPPVGAQMFSKIFKK